jgi:hypothetical protein
VYLNDDALQIFRILLEKRSLEETNSPYLILNLLAIEDKMHLGPLDKRIRRLQPLLIHQSTHTIKDMTTLHKPLKICRKKCKIDI